MATLNARALEAAQEHTPGRFLKIGDVADRVSLSTRTIRRLVQAGTFPQPILITDVRKAWLLSEVEAWMAQKIAAARIQQP